MKLTKPTPNTEIQNGMIPIPDVEVIIKPDPAPTEPTKKKYLVTRYLVYTQEVEVMASSPEDAVGNVMDGNHGQVIDEPCYAYTMDDQHDVSIEDDDGDWQQVDW